MIAIKKMEMPSSCFYCPLIHKHPVNEAKCYCGALWVITLNEQQSELKLKEIKDGRSVKCPLIEINEVEND